MKTKSKNPHAVALGRRGGAASAGKPKRFTPEEIAKRSQRLDDARKLRWQTVTDSAEIEAKLSAKIARLQASSNKGDRLEAGQLGEMLGEWKRGQIGDAAIKNAARE